MNINSWFSRISFKQRIWLFVTVAGMLAIIALGTLLSSSGKSKESIDFETFSILLTVIIALLVSFITYRPFCHFICPFGLVSWIAERFSIFRVRIDKEKCNQCGACIKACPLEAAKGRVNDKKMPADCFSCARCLNVCPVDAIQYASLLKKGIKY